VRWKWTLSFQTDFITMFWGNSVLWNLLIYNISWCLDRVVIYVFFVRTKTDFSWFLTFVLISWYSSILSWFSKVPTFQEISWSKFKNLQFLSHILILFILKIQKKIQIDFRLSWQNFEMQMQHSLHKIAKKLCFFLLLW
jgi:hypothetical protein